MIRIVSVVVRVVAAYPVFMLCAAITAVVGYVLGFHIWKAGLIFQMTSGLWGPAMLIAIFVLSARIFRLEE